MSEPTPEQKLRTTAANIRTVLGNERAPDLEAYVAALEAGADALATVEAQGRPRHDELLKRVVTAWDADDDLEFLAATTAARHALGLTLACIVRRSR